MPAKKMNRRTFLRSAAVAVSAAVAAGCGAVRRTGFDEGIVFGPRATPQIVLPSPMPHDTPSPDGEALLPGFLALSALLTGVPNLDPQLGQIYLASLQRGETAGQVAELLQEIAVIADTPPTTLAELEETGLLAQQGMDGLTGQITKLWYTGIYPNEDGEDTVATYVDSLAWQTLRFTKPKTICGYPGFWEEPWTE
jgi:hypothetical protein